MGAFVLADARILNEGKLYRGFVAVDPPYIIEVGAGDYHGDLPARDLGGRLLMPGVIDTHVHFREPGLTAKADIRSESRAAAAGGVTSYFDMPNCVPQTVTREALDDKFRRAAGDSLVNYSFYIGATRDNLDVLATADYSRVPGVKLFLGASTGGMQVEDEEYLDRIFRLPRRISVHSEDQAIINRNAAIAREKYPEGGIPMREHARIRSAEACRECTRKAVERARRHGTRLHVCHISTADELQFLTPGIPLEKKQITGEVCVQHLWFSDRDYDRLGAKIKCNPAVKGAEHRDALRRAVRDGLIDVVSTDHAPHLPADKEGDALHAASGIPLVQFSLPCMLEGARRGWWSLERVVELMCHNPAQLFGIERRGFLRPGYYADLVIVGETPSEVTRESILSKCGWSPFEGETFSHKVSETYVNGRRVYPFGENGGAAMPLRFGK